MKQYDPNKRPPFSFTYREMTGAQKLSLEKIEEARRLGWPLWERVLKNEESGMYVEGTYLAHAMTSIADEHGKPIVYSWELKMKLMDAMHARRNFPTPDDPFEQTQEVTR